MSAPFVYGWALATRVHIWYSSRHLPSPDPTDLRGEAAGDPPVKPLPQGCAGGGSASFLSPPPFHPKAVFRKRSQIVEEDFMAGDQSPWHGSSLPVLSSRTARVWVSGPGRLRVMGAWGGGWGQGVTELQH